MSYVARLGTSKGDAMEVRFEYKFPWGPDGYKGRYMAGREAYYNYGSNIGVFVKISDQRELPVKILSEISTTYGNIHGYSQETFSACLNYELEHMGENCYLCETDNEIVISRVTGSELRETSNNQYVKFTLVYDGFTVPLIDPINGSPDFQINLCSARGGHY